MTHAAEVVNEFWTTPAGRQVNVLAVDPASYAELAARTRDSRGAGRAAGDARRVWVAQPVLVSPQAAADLGTAAVTLGTRQASLRPVQVRWRA